MSKYHASAHSTYNVAYHIVFSTKYRYNLLWYRAAEKLKHIFLQEEFGLGITIQAMEVMSDHVHLFITASPTVAVPKVVRRLKGCSSYLMRKEFAYLRKYPSLWTRSYFVETIGNISESTVVKYIENQKSKALSSPG